jgi:RNA polymerase sigma-70 factor (ECF subfamily)
MIWLPFRASRRPRSCWYGWRRRITDALRVLYRRFAPRRLALPKRILGDRAAAEALLDQALLKMWSTSSRLSRQGVSVAAFSGAGHAPWLSSSSARPGGRSRAGLAELVRGVPNARKGGPARPSALSYEKVLNQLPQHQRKALYLLAFEGCTESEVAAKLGEPPGLAQSGRCAFFGTACVRAETADI